MTVNRLFSARAAAGLAVTVFVLALSVPAVGDSGRVSFKREAGRLEIRIDDQRVAVYVYEDPALPRPYFCQLTTRGGVQVTRSYPPDPVVNKGNDDHATFHPGTWLAFGDLGGRDFWRNKARVRHVQFVEPFVESAGFGSFAVVNRYEGEDGPNSAVCEETCTYSVHADSSGYFLTVRSEFRSEKADFSFGDQEEMGFGVRLNTPLTVKFGSGGIVNSEGGKNEEGTWGRQARWCAAAGTVDGKPVAVAVMVAPENFRPSWFHTRNYGLIVANPFGRKAMTGPEDAAVAPDATVVKKGETFRLGFGVWVSDGVPASLAGPQDAYGRWLAFQGKDR
jgi:hypothetical protein